MTVKKDVKDRVLYDVLGVEPEASPGIRVNSLPVSVYQSLSPSTSQSVSESRSERVSQPVSQLVSESASKWVSQSVSQSVSEWVSEWVSEPVSHWVQKCRHQSSNQWVTQLSPLIWWSVSHPLITPFTFTFLSLIILLISLPSFSNSFSDYSFSLSPLLLIFWAHPVIP